MDLFKTIRELLDEKQKLNEVIAYLEALSGANLNEKERAEQLKRIPGRRGRKSMDPEERAEVSRRMKQYWDKRRKKAAGAS
jgi:hypothetical protein